MLPIGKITRTRGNKGQVVVSFVPGAALPGPGSPVELRSRKRTFPHVIEGISACGPDAVVAFRGVDTIDAALRLVGCALWAGTAAAGAAGGGDVLGFRVYDRDGDFWGTVVSRTDHSLNRVLEIADGSGGVILVPWHESLVASIDRDAGVLVIDPPAGLRELNR